MMPKRQRIYLVLSSSRDGTRLRVLGSQHKGNDEAIKTKSFGEDEHENHADKNGRLLRVGTNTSVTNDADAHSGSEAGKTTDDATRKMGE